MLPEVERRPFGTLADGHHASLFLLHGEDGVSAAVTDYGASLVSLIVPDRDGAPGDVLLSCDSATALQRDDSYLGAAIGRVAGRIGGAAFTLDGEAHALSANEPPNHLHGGTTGFGRRKWKARAVEGHFPAIAFDIVSPAGDEGYPDEVTASVSYELQPPARLAITFVGSTDGATPFNPTSHGYFNLDGHDAGSIGDHWLQLCASRYTPVGPGRIPTGEVRPVDGTAFDFRNDRCLGQAIDGTAEGYDTNFVIDGEAGTLRRAAVVRSPASGRAMTVWTDRPCVHLYTGFFLDVAEGKGGATYPPSSGLALETQGYPDALNHPEFPADVLRASQPFRSRTILDLHQDDQP